MMKTTRIRQAYQASAIVMCLLFLGFFCSCGNPSSRQLSGWVNSVVKIETVVKKYADGRSLLSRGTGAGVVISPNGEVVTNYHVVGGAVRITATLYNGKELEAKVVGLDPWTDLALVKLEDVNNLPHIEFGNSEKLKYGDTVYAIGSPRMLRHTVSKGIISSPRRFLASEMFFSDGSKTGTFTAWLQTDALVESGSSGGPLLDSEGRLAGIVARSYSAGSGFAVPSVQVKYVVEAIRNKGEVTRGWLGITWAPSKKYAKAIGASESITGALVTEVDEESPFAGLLLPGDIVTDINNHLVLGRYEVELPELRNLVAKLQPGTEVIVKYFRMGQDISSVRSRVMRLEPSVGVSFECKEWGIVVRGITREMKHDLNLPDARGVQVSSVRSGSAATTALIGAGYIIRKAFGKEISGIDEFISLYRKNVSAGKALVETTAGMFNILHYIEYTESEDEE